MRVRIQNLGGLRHEPDAAECDDVAVGLAGFSRKFEAVADHVREFLNLGFLVMMREQNRAPVALEVKNLFG